MTHPYLLRSRCMAAAGLLGAVCLLSAGLAACTAGRPAATPVPAPSPAPAQLTLYSWAEYMPQSVLDAFTAATGVTVIYHTYESQDEAAAAIMDGSAPFDVAVVAYDQVPLLAEAGALARLDRANLPNFQNISPDFRNLFFDPANEYTVPYLWGTTGLLVRTDRVAAPVTHWRDLWDGQLDGSILVRPIADELLGAALLSLGYDFNSEDPAELEAALARLLLLKPALEYVPVTTEDALASLVSGDAVAMIGWNGDAVVARAENSAITYVLPEEGAIAWVDNFVVSAHSTNQALAEAFINFVLRPEISAEITEAYYYPSANEAANQYVDAALRADPLLFPAPADTNRLVFYLPHSPEVEQYYADLWQRFEQAP